MSVGEVQRGFCRHEALSPERQNEPKKRDPDRLLSDKIITLFSKKEHAEIGALLARQSGVSLRALRELVGEECKPLSCALRAAEAILDCNIHFLNQPGEVAKLAFFIETELAEKIVKREHIVLGSETHSRAIIEYDQVSKKTVIYSEDKSDDKIGAGCKKVVTKALLYDARMPTPIALCRTAAPVQKEIAYTKRLQGARGIVELHAVIQHDASTQAALDPLLLALKLYNGGTLKSVFTEQTYIFTIPEKIKIASDLLHGLKAIHDNGLMHCDLHSGNFLIQVIQKKDSQEREIGAVIADFGRIARKKMTQGIYSQPNPQYRGPEDYFHENLAGNDYESVELFALGCTLYQLFYERAPEWWHGARFFKQRHATDEAVEKEQKELSQAILAAIKPRKRALSGWCCFGRTLSTEERLEALILRMVDPAMRMRGTLAAHVAEIEAIERAVQ